MARVLLLDGATEADVFELVELTEDTVRVRSPFLFEVGEQLALRIEHAGKRTDTHARVTAHIGDAAAKITELALDDGRA